LKAQSTELELLLNGERIVHCRLNTSEVLNKFVEPFYKPLHKKTLKENI